MTRKFKLGDKVRSLGGVEGEVVRLNADRRSVTVKVPGDWPSGPTVSIPIVRLRPISDHPTAARRRSRPESSDLFPRLLA